MFRFSDKDKEGYQIYKCDCHLDQMEVSGNLEDRTMYFCTTFYLGGFWYRLKNALAYLFGKDYTKSEIVLNLEETVELEKQINIFNKGVLELKSGEKGG